MLVLPGQIYLRYFNHDSLIYLSVMFLVILTLRYVYIYMTYFHGQLLYLGSDVLP